jgi:hypothetical protein
MSCLLLSLPTGMSQQSQQCVELHVSTDKLSYTFGETAIIRIDFIHSRAGCVEDPSPHDHIIDVYANGLLLDQRYNGNYDKSYTIAWTPTSANTFNIQACSWRQKPDHLSGPPGSICGSASIIVSAHVETVTTTAISTATSTVYSLPPMDYPLLSVGVGIAIASIATALALRKRRAP